MRPALELQWRMLRSATVTRITTVLLVIGIPGLTLGMVGLARSADTTSVGGAKLAPYAEGTFGESAASFAAQMTPVLVLIGGGFTVAWIVGREWSDATIGALFALPVSRATLARAKLLVAAAWGVAALSVGMMLTVIGLAVVAPGSFTADVSVQLGKAWVTGLAMIALTTPFGWVAAATRGYLGAAGAIIGVTAVSQILATVGVGEWIPYVAPALWSGAAGDDAAAAVGPWALVWVGALAAVGAWGTVRAMARAVID